MECIFLNSAGVTLFTRNDMEQGHWVCQEMNMTADFPFDPNKVIEHGQRIAFRDPATDTLQVFEIRVVVNSQPDHYQQITAEHICLAELQDEHIDKTEITNKTAKKALQTALTGTLWSAGTSYDSSTQSADFSRGSVWDAISTIQDNWNVHIVPRVTISAAGVITGRYLDIYPVQVYVEAGGPIGPGVRLSVRKNMLDPAVTYDDEEVITAMYGYGGSVLVPQQNADDKSEELTFKDQVWTASDGHPAKPSGQTYLEWPEKTALYGRGAAGSKRPRFGYYQNANIKDAAVLLQKTWESLQLSSDPKISISGTVIDLYRLGYKDQPLKLHDMVIVEIEETGELFVKQITCLDVDLVDPTGTRVDIGDYIPNIVYINRDTNKKASGGGGGGGGRGSMTDLEDEQTKYVTWFDRTDRTIGMYMGIKNGDVYLKTAQICLEINDSDETVAHIDADHVNISATSTAHMLAGELEYDAQGRLVIKNAGGMYVQRTSHGTTAYFGVWDDGNITSGMVVSKINGETSTTIKADYIDIDGIVTALIGKYISCGELSVDSAGISCEGDIQLDGDISCAGVVGCDGIETNSLELAGDDAEWKSKPVCTSISVTHIGYNTYKLANDKTLGANFVTGVSGNYTTINYVGGADS
jgi:phage minor structural protein